MRPRPLHCSRTIRHSADKSTGKGDHPERLETSSLSRSSSSTYSSTAITTGHVSAPDVRTATATTTAASFVLNRARTDGVNCDLKRYPFRKRVRSNGVRSVTSCDAIFSSNALSHHSG